MPIKLTKEQFIEKSIKKHGEKFDYSNINYINGKTKIEILCKTHGPFMQRPDSHLNTTICCPKCCEYTAKNNNTKKLTTKEYILKAKEAHQDKYDYNNLNYLGMSNKVEVICRKHGSFWQVTRDHLHHGCSRCGADRRTKSHTYSFQQFLEKARSAHGNRYEYCEESYSMAVKNIKIKCKVYGYFYQSADAHYYVKRGCPKCNTGKPPNKTIEHFLKSAREIHGDKYDYSKVNIINYGTKVEIICKEHGSFF